MKNGLPNLWAPWRVEYIKDLNKKGLCFFCRYLRQNSRNDRKNLVLLRGERCVAIMNRFPYNTGHMMVAPKKHKGKLQNLSEAEMLELLTMTRDIQGAITKVIKPHAFNIGINMGRVAGAGVLGHLHIHVVPRWDADTNFMPIIAGTKVIPYALDKLYIHLKKAINNPELKK